MLKSKWHSARARRASLVAREKRLDHEAMHHMYKMAKGAAMQCWEQER